MVKQIIEILYRSRQTRKVHPRGTFEQFRIWHPDENERCDCCDRIMPPNVAYPYSLHVHCRTRKHIKNKIKKLGIYHPDIVAELFKIKEIGERERERKRAKL